ncbi:MAG: OmpH family outer membrane protein [Nitrospinae bacterium]|nr:OmpH family outer membrane protein [Nitrospinota bacterium]
MEPNRFFPIGFTVNAFLVICLILMWSVPSAFGASSKVGFIDMQKAISSTKNFQKEMVQYQKDYKDEQKKINAREVKIKEAKEELEKQGFVLSPELKAKKETQWREDFKNFKRYVQDQNEMFQRKRDEIGRKILVKMMDVIGKVGKEKKFSVILEKKSVLYSDTSIDLTDAVVKKFDSTSK